MAWKTRQTTPLTGKWELRAPRRTKAAKNGQVRRVCPHLIARSGSAALAECFYAVQGPELTLPTRA